MAKYKKIYLFILSALLFQISIINSAEDNDIGEVKFYNLEKEYRETITKIYQPKYALALELKLIIENMLSIYGNVYVNEKDNTIYITDVKEKIDDIFKILPSLDKKDISAGGNLKTEVVFLKHIKGQEILEFLNHKLSKEGKIFINPLMNALIITDIPSKIEEVKGLVIQLDKSTPHIEIDVAIVEINEKYQRRVGIDVFSFLESIYPRVHYYKYKGKKEEKEDKDDFDYTSSYLGIYSYVELSELLQLMVERGIARLLGRTRITTQNNKKAVISATESIPFKYPWREFKYDLMELTQIYLSVVPNIQEDNRINLDITPRVKSLSGFGQHGRPIIYESYLTTNITVGNNQTIVLGGLEKKTAVEYTRGVPILKDIPGIKYLFSRTRKYSLKRDIIFFITPKIVIELKEEKGKDILKFE